MVKKRKIRIVLDVLMLIVTLLFAVFLMRQMVNSVIKTKQPFVAEQGQLDVDMNNYEVKAEPQAMFDGLDLDQYIEGQYTILLLGMDEEGLNTDVMMLMVCDLNTAKISILQIPRDCYVGVAYTNNEIGKINSVYSEGNNTGSNGINKVVNCVRDLFGIPIDSYMAIKCTDVAPVVDAMGGIPINLPEDVIYEADKILYKGQQTLTGEQSEWFVRFRHDYLEGDIGRIKSQRYFLAAAMQKVKDLGTLKIVSIYPTLKDYIMSDLDISEIGMLADFAQTVPMENVVARMVPGEELVPGDINEFYGYSMHKEETADVLNEYFRPYQASIYADDLKITEVKHTANYYDDDQTSFDDIMNGNGPDVQRREDQNQLED